MRDAVDFHGLSPSLQSQVAMPLIVEHTGTGGAESSGMIRAALRCSAALPACAVSLFVLATAGRAGAADCALERQGGGGGAARGAKRRPCPREGRRKRPPRHEGGGSD